MNVKEFDTLMTNLNKVVKECNDIIKDFKSKESVLKWTVSEYQQKCERARKMQSETDHILHSDLYHIIGMGNLSVSQNAKFLKQVKVLGEARTKIKLLACQDIDIPEIPKTSEYKCTLLNKKMISEIKK